MKIEEILNLLQKQTLMSIGTQGINGPDNSIVCFAFDKQCNLYFGSYSDTLKCKNITIGTLQVHGHASIVSYGTNDYYKGRIVYDSRFPQYKKVFEFKNNELYKIEPLVIWNYNPSKGEMHRDSVIFDQRYDSIDVYKPHYYEKR